jgi:UDP-N-acetylmuramate dehydrogenase
VVWAELALDAGDRTEAEALIAEIVRWRREHQPGGANAGSVFTNPPGDYAGRLIDAAGAKGLRHGSAEVSTKHANFIQADEGGSADDVLALMRAVQARVLERSGIRLEPETRLVGFDPEDGPDRAAGEEGDRG